MKLIRHTKNSYSVKWERIEIEKNDKIRIKILKSSHIKALFDFNFFNNAKVILIF